MKYEEFEKLSEEDRWKWIVKNPSKVALIELDNDVTFVTLKGWVDQNSTFQEEWLGNGPGIETLLKAIGINACGV